ncbi:class I SAM-dependent methyltransferase [Alteribacter populi]|uniref:class I SAM-dependent methyltransferase n=1 Tax=Alteribacter populi TaxID=2011011 RepID=UPI0012FF82C5|nr:class I SAM-dependent methyltransferase [Alteribacter populi]
MRKFTSSEFDDRVEFFDRMAQTKWLSALHAQLLSALGSWEGKNILDIGCGTGRILAKGAIDNANLTGIDLSKAMVTRSEQLLKDTHPRTKTQFVVADAERLPFQNDHFNVSLAACVLFLMPEPLNVLKEVHRVSTSKGKIGLLNPSKNISLDTVSAYIEKHRLTGDERNTLMQWGRVSEKRHRFSSERIEALLTEAGWCNVSHYSGLEEMALITVATKA